MRKIVADQLKQTVNVLQQVAEDEELHNVLIEAAEKTAAALRAGRKLMVAGNGGSAADAQHLVAEFVGRLVQNRPALRAVALTTDSSILTAVGNDYGYECVFARQIEALGQPGDIFLAISTSGTSPNIVRALELARTTGIVTIGLTGAQGGRMLKLCDFCLRIPSAVTMNIQEAHLALEHIFCLLVEHIYFDTNADEKPALSSSGR
ncbi:MAG: D-sedoheptulose-7-phosphate isomerase [Acidobacteriaceae bacterium]